MLKRIFPFFIWLKKYQKKDFFADFLAGMVLSVILLPKSMAYAMLAGLPPVYGLYACLLSPAIASLWGSSKHLSTGPAAVISFLVFASVSQLAGVGSPEFISFAILLAVMVGVIQIALSVFKMGWIMNFISHSVIVGFTNAAAIIIAVSQIKDILGIKIENSDILFENIINLIKNIGHTNIYAMMIGIASIILIFFAKKIHKLFPGGILAIIIFTFVTGYFGWDVIHHIKIIGDIPNTFPTPTIPVFDFAVITKLLPIAFVMAIIGFMEAYSIAKVIGSKTKQKIDINQELIGQGLSNIITGFIKGYPVSGSFSGTAVNYQAGAKTGISNVIASISIIVVLLYFSQYLYYLPKAVLGAIVVVAVIGLFKPQEMLHIYKINKLDGGVAIFTFIISLLIKSDYAIFLGVIVSLVFFLYKTMRPKFVVLSRNKELNKFVNVDTYKLDTCPQIMLIRPEMSIYFANSEYIFETLESILKKNKDLKYLLIEAGSINTIDATAIEYMLNFFDDVKKSDKEVYFINMKSDLVNQLKDSGVIDKIGEQYFLISKNQVIAKFFKNINHDFCKKCKYKIFDECQNIRI